MTREERTANGSTLAWAARETEPKQGWLQSLVQKLAGRISAVRRSPVRRTLRHVETLSLGQKRTIYLIECDGNRFLVTDGMSAPVAVSAKSSMHAWEASA